MFPGVQGHFISDLRAGKVAILLALQVETLAVGNLVSGIRVKKVLDPGALSQGKIKTLMEAFSVTCDVACDVYSR